MANLVLKDVSKLYPSGALALCKVNLEVSDKEFIAVIGAEKSGKTTLLRVIAGLDDATSGQIIIGGKDMTGVHPKDRDVAMIFRNDTLYPSINVYENMAYGLKIRKTPQVAVEQRVKAAAEILGLTDVLTRKPKMLTAAQRQRVALGRAIAREPKLYLLDDPIAGLDDNLKAQMRSIIVSLQARMEGTFIYATKNVNEALTMATRVVVLREGVIQQVDTPANLYDYPANAYVGLLVGSPAMNMISGATLEEVNGVLVAAYKGVNFAISPEVAARLEDKQAYVGTGRKVIVGIRPEDVVWGEGEDAAVTATEEADGRLYAECQLSGDLSLLALAPAGTAKGGAAKIKPDGARIYLFDGQTRLTLLSRDGGYEQTSYSDASVQPMAYEEEEQLKTSLKPVPPAKDKKRR